MLTTYAYVATYMYIATYTCSGNNRKEGPYFDLDVHLSSWGLLTMDIHTHVQYVHMY